MFGFGRKRTLSSSQLDAITDAQAEIENAGGEDILLLAIAFAESKRWEATNGFEITEEMVAVVSVYAAQMSVGLPDGSFDHVRGIVMSPTFMTLDGEYETEDGFISNEARHVDGHTSFDGNVYLAWDVIDMELRHPEWIAGLVFHELAHQLDNQEGVSNGTPLMRDEAQLARWVEVCTPAFEAVQAGVGPRCIDEYAAEDPAEFFAVVSETFFRAGADLKHEAPDLYEVLADFYGQRLIN